MGGGGAGTPPATSFQSVAFASVLDAVCEGEIQGLVNGAQSIYFNGVPVIESNGQANFVGTTIGWTNGTQTQPSLPGFASVQATAMLGTQVLNSVPISSQIDNVNANAVIITLSVGALSNTNSDGSISGTSVNLLVSYQPTGSAAVQALNVTFDGYTGTRYERTYQFALTGTGPWTVTVTRTTSDSTVTTLVNPTYVDAVTTVVNTKLSYPNTALVGIQVDARQFSSLPSRAYLIQGLLIQVPNNYNPLNHLYSGVWDGGFQIAYSNNPAWCLYDLLTSDRYGLGNYINSYEADTAALYEIGQYCDELVPDGFGGQQPRFTLNTCITQPKDAYSVIQDLCSVFRGMTYWGAGTILTTQDAPFQGPMPLFSPANVVNGQFTYSGSMRKDRHTVAYVTYNDPTQLYMQAVEYVEDPEGIARYGVRPINIMAVGTTSRGQAYRQGMWQLLTERLDTDQLQFTAGMDAATLTPGTIIQIADPVRAGERMGGRTIAGTTSGITLDAPVTLQAGQSYTLYYMDSTGAQQTVGVVNTAQTTAALTFTTTAPAAPGIGFMWMLSGSNINPQLFRVINVQESAQNTFDVLAITYNESKFGAIDFNTALQLPPISVSLSLVATMPTSWTIVDTSYLIAPGTIGQKIIMSWSGNTAQYMFQWRANGGPWQSTTLSTSSYAIEGVSAGSIYDFQVYGISVDQSTSQPLVETFTVPALGAPPGAPTNLTASPNIASVVLNWAAPNSLGLAYFQVYMSTVNDVTKATVLGSNIGTTTWTASGLIAGDTYYFWVNAVTTSGVVGPFNSTIGTAATVLYVQPGAFQLGGILSAIATSQEITSAELALQAVTQQNIAAQAVGTAQIQDAAVATAKIGTSAVTTTNIADAAITTAKIENAAITTALIGTAAIGTAQIQNAAITSALIADLSVGTAHIQQAAVTTLTIAGQSVTTGAFIAAAGDTASMTYYASGGQCTILYTLADPSAVTTVAYLVIDGNQVTPMVPGTGFYGATLSTGNHSIYVAGSTDNPGGTTTYLSVFEAKR